MTDATVHPYLRYLAAWDRDEAGFQRALDGLAGRPVRFAGSARRYADARACLAALSLDPMAAITEAADGTLLLPGNPHRVLRQLLDLAYLPPSNPWWSRMPRSLARSAGRWRRQLPRPESTDPDEDREGALHWPDDPRADHYRRDLYLGLRAERHAAVDGGGDTPRPDRPWPGRARYALCLTYEVASREGTKLVGHTLERTLALGVRPCYFVAGQSRLWDHDALSAVREAGGEIGLLGAGGEDLADARPDRIRKVLDRAQPLVDRHRIAGYRHRSSRVTEALLTVAGERFVYDSSIPDTARCPITGVPRGCGVTVPFRHQSLLELPVTVPPDQYLLEHGYVGLDYLQLVRDKAMALRARGGVVTLVVRLEPALGGSRVQLDLLAALLSELLERGDAWVTTPGELARHWDRALAVEPGAKRPAAISTGDPAAPG